MRDDPGFLVKVAAATIVFGLALCVAALSTFVLAFAAHAGWGHAP